MATETDALTLRLVEEAFLNFQRLQSRHCKMGPRSCRRSFRRLVHVLNLLRVQLVPWALRKRTRPCLHCSCFDRLSFDSPCLRSSSSYQCRSLWGQRTFGKFSYMAGGHLECKVEWSQEMKCCWRFHRTFWVLLVSNRSVYYFRFASIPRTLPPDIVFFLPFDNLVQSLTCFSPFLT